MTEEDRRSAESFCEILNSFMGQNWENARKHGAKQPLRDCPLCAGVGFVCGEGSGVGYVPIKSCDCIWPKLN